MPQTETCDICGAKVRAGSCTLALHGGSRVMACGPCRGFPAQHPDADQIERTIYLAAVRALYADAFINQQEEKRERGKKHVHPGQGGEWMDVVPKKAPKGAFDAAARLTQAIETQNGERLITLWLNTAKRDDLDPEDSEMQRKFGHYLAMQALGHGVGWADDHQKLTFKVPHIDGLHL